MIADERTSNLDGALVLVVDDDEPARYVKVRTLQRAGFATVEAARGLQALELARAAQPDLVLLDIKLPDIDGFEVCAQLRADSTTAGIPIVQISATFETPEHQVRGLEGGADTFLVSPVEPTVLTATVRAMLRMRHAEASMREYDRRKDHFLATLAHELRGPLAPLRYSLDLLAERTQTDAGTKDVLAMMKRQTDHLARLVDDLVDISRINENKLTLRPARVTLAAIFEHVVESYRPDLQRMGHTLRVDLPEDDVEFYADGVRLAQAFGNLLSNSIKYTEPGGEITITAQVAGERLTVAMTDTGIGLKSADLSRVFEMFVQVADVGTGLGIGLALVSRIIQMHGGSVQASSAGPGRGSTFTVTLPLRDLPMSEEARPIESAAAAPRKVLVVDDDADAVDALTELLRMMGHDVRSSYDARGGIAAASEFRPDVIFIDISMPGMSGLDAVQLIRGEPWSQGTLICTISGHGRAADRQRSAQAGVDVHLVKPVDVDTLRRTIARASHAA